MDSGQLCQGFFTIFWHIDMTHRLRDWLVNKQIVYISINDRNINRSLDHFWYNKFEATVQLKFTSATNELILGEKFQEMLTDTRIQSNYSNHWPTLNIASPDLLSTLQNWHDGVIWDSTPPLIASDEGMVDRLSHAQKTEEGSCRARDGRTRVGRVWRWAMLGRYQCGWWLYLRCYNMYKIYNS